MVATFLGLQFCVDIFVTVPAAVVLALIVLGAGTFYALTAHILCVVPAVLLRQSHN